MKELRRDPQRFNAWADRVIDGWLKKAELAETLAGLETRLIRRLAVAFARSPESFLEEAEALDLVIRLKRELRE